MTTDATSPADLTASAPPLRLGSRAPLFTASSTAGTVNLADYRGRWLILFSHPADFTPVCTSEFVALARLAPKFEALGCALLGHSVDNLSSHVAWLRAIKSTFDTEVPFPVIEDETLEIARAYGMVDAQTADSATVRAAFFINPEGIIRAIHWYPATVGRSAHEMLRLVTALQRVEAGDAVSPEGWCPGDPLLLPLSGGRQIFDADDDWFCRRIEGL